MRYTATAMTLHWFGALRVSCGFGLALFMTGLESAPEKLRYCAWHKGAGITVFLLAAARLARRAAHPAPALPATMPQWQVRASHVAHAELLALMPPVPPSGWIYRPSEGGSDVCLGLLPLPDLAPKDRKMARIRLLVHKTLNSTLAAVVPVRVVAALKHRFVDRDHILARMLPGR